jgi:phosphoglycolate phosphatase-like HAD superfamily hydrolase
MQYKKSSPKVFEGVKGKFKEIIFIGDSLEDYYSARDAGICFYAMLT